MRRVADPPLLSSREETVAKYGGIFREHEDLTSAYRRNYHSYLCQFAARYAASCVRNTDDMALSQNEFDPRAIAKPALTRYHTHLQKYLCLKPNSVNRALTSLKRYWQIPFAPSARTIHWS